MEIISKYLSSFGCYVGTFIMFLLFLSFFFILIYIRSKVERSCLADLGLTVFFCFGLYHSIFIFIKLSEDCRDIVNCNIEIIERKDSKVGKHTLYSIFVMNKLKDNKYFLLEDGSNRTFHQYGERILFLIDCDKSKEFKVFDSKNKDCSKIYVIKNKCDLTEIPTPFPPSNPKTFVDLEVNIEEALINVNKLGVNKISLLIKNIGTKNSLPTFIDLKFDNSTKNGKLSVPALKPGNIEKFNVEINVDKSMDKYKDILIASADPENLNKDINPSNNIDFALINVDLSLSKKDILCSSQVDCFVDSEFVTSQLSNNNVIFYYRNPKDKRNEYKFKIEYYNSIKNMWINAKLESTMCYFGNYTTFNFKKNANADSIKVIYLFPILNEINENEVIKKGEVKMKIFENKLICTDIIKSYVFDKLNK